MVRPKPVQPRREALTRPADIDGWFEGGWHGGLLSSCRCNYITGLACPTMATNTTAAPSEANMNEPQPGDIQLRAWRAFLTAHARVTEALERELVQEQQLPLSWYDVLVQLSEAPDQRLRMHG